jgi:myo-inositol-1(or 4)-monophosphatase
MLQTAIEAAREAGRIIMDNLNTLDKNDVDKKMQFDFVTHVDKACEERIVSRIKETYPSHSFYAEEGYKEEGEYRWIIDPLDGTTNYIHGVPFFSVSIALEYKKDIILGVVYDPCRDELFTVEKGKGAFLNGKPIIASSVVEPERSILTTGFPFRAKNYLEAYLETFRRLFLIMSGIRRMGSAALDFCYVACGRSEGFWEIGLSPWDVAAGALMIKEAGGCITDFSGGDEAIWSGNVVASNGHIHGNILTIVQDVFKGIIDK